MPCIGPKGSGVGAGVTSNVCVIPKVGVAVGALIVGVAIDVTLAVEAIRYANAATSVLHTNTTIAIIKNLAFALFHRVILFSLPNDIMISLADDI